MTEPTAGDVVLVEQLGGPTGPISELIQRVTGSPYSHSIVALGDGSFADANPVPGAGNDVCVFDEAGLAERLRGGRTKSVSLFRLRVGPADGPRLAEAVERWRCRGDVPGAGRITFSDGALAGLALLRVLQALPDMVRTGPRCQRLQAAVFWALEDGDARLFCSEFVHRVLSDVDRRPELPVRPIVSPDGFPTDEPAWADGTWLERVRDWVVERWPGLNELDLDDASLETFSEVWSRIQDAYQDERTPERLEIANFFTPADFAASPSFDLAAMRTPHSGGWGAPAP